MSFEYCILQEIVCGRPFSELERQAYSVQAHRVLEAVGLKQIPVATPLQQLSGGYKRRVALAVQLVRRPAVSSLIHSSALPTSTLSTLAPTVKVGVHHFQSCCTRHCLWTFTAMCSVISFKGVLRLSC